MNKILNLGCGLNRITGADNADSAENVEADIKMDLKVFPWPIADDAYDTVYLFHVIEHLEKKFWPQVLCEIWRVLKAGGTFVISYPEFEKVAKNWLSNEGGLRSFWENTIFGRQLYTGDYHVSLMYTPELHELMIGLGFDKIEVRAEPDQAFNTVVRAVKGPKLPTYEDLIKLELQEA